MHDRKQRVNQRLKDHIPQPKNTSLNLYQAMHHAVFPGGKRVRPILVYASGEMLGANTDTLDDIACSVELVHCYSLVHDDLPAMDNDDLRRGKPTCHKAFDEATAILVGDGLQSRAFELLTQVEQIEPVPRLTLIQQLSGAIGCHGMVAGQALDLAADTQETDLQSLERLHRHKTGALITAAITMGAIAAQADSSTLDALTVAGYCVGLAFQIQDDILDIESSTETLGKRQGADTDRNKVTFPSLMGLTGAKRHMDACYQKGIEALKGLTGPTEPLTGIIEQLMTRRS